MAITRTTSTSSYSTSYHPSHTQRQWYFLSNSFPSSLFSTLRSFRRHSSCSAIGGTRFLETDWQCCWKFNFHFSHQNFDFGLRFTQLSFWHHDIRGQEVKAECCAVLIMFNFCLNTDDDCKGCATSLDISCASTRISSKNFQISLSVMINTERIQKLWHNNPQQRKTMFKLKSPDFFHLVNLQSF